MNILTTLYNHLGYLKSVLLHERVLKKVAVLYCIVDDEDSHFLETDELDNYLTLNDVANNTLIKEIHNLCSSMTYLYHESLKHLDYIERRNDFFYNLSYDSLLYFTYTILPDFHVYDVKSNIIDEHFSLGYSRVEMHELEHYFIELEALIIKMEKIKKTIELYYPKFKNEKVYNLYRDDFAINNPNKHHHWGLSMFIQFSFLDFENMEYLHPHEEVIDEEKETCEIERKNLHHEYFKDDAILKFENCLRNFDISDKRRSDMKFIFEQMKKDSLIHGDVKQSSFLKFVSEKYNIHLEKTSNYSITKQRLNLYSIS